MENKSTPSLRPYQCEDVNYLSRLQSAGCFNEQRTGKTPTALKVIEAKGLTKVVIISPGSAIIQWQEEYERWLGKPCIAAIGTPKQRQKLLTEWTHGLIISYDTFKTTLAGTGMMQDIIKLNPEMLIIDEAHRIKSRQSARAKAVLACKNIPHKLALTATPAPGKPEEIFTILQFLYPERFTSYWKFIAEYFKQDKKYNPRAGQYYIEINGFKPQKEKQLQEFLNTMSTCRKRKEVMPWLPDKDKTQIKLEPTKQQSKYLKELSEFYETEHIIVQGALDRLIRYRQICLDPKLLELPSKSPKTDWIIQYIKDYPDENIIIFSKFTSYLKTLKPLLDPITSTELMIGETKVKTRNELKLDFQKDKFKVLLLNLDVGKEALTLDKASTIIFTDKYPPIGDIEQAEDRFVATTKERANKPHKIYELMIKGTYDEQLYKLLEQRKSETDVLNNYKHYINERRNPK